MKLCKDKKYTVIDIGLIKWSCIFFGMALGAYLADFISAYAWLFIIAALLLAIKPALAYFKED